MRFNAEKIVSLNVFQSFYRWFRCYSEKLNEVNSSIWAYIFWHYPRHALMSSIPGPTLILEMHHYQTFQQNIYNFM